jgi:deoxyribodipyrimidine photo-lyase
MANSRPARPDGRFVLYWMTTARRVTSNFALERAVESARMFDAPLVILSALSVDYPWASDRLHRFIIAGMADNVRALDGQPVTFLPYVEPEEDAGAGLIEALAHDACLVVTDDFPCGFLPRVLTTLAGRMRVRVEAVDSNGILPMRTAPQCFPTAFSFRSYMQNTLADVIAAWPAPIDFTGLRTLTALPAGIAERWPATPLALLDQPGALIASLPLDHSIGPVDMPGGSRAAHAALRRFVREALPRYADDHSQPSVHGTSRLSPYLHFGHISAHEVFAAVMTAEGWTPRQLNPEQAGGAREGWWGLGPHAEHFLDQLVTWRELGFNMCAMRPDEYDRYVSLPPWALKTLARHANDPRPYVYSVEQLERARTHDPVWNAAQRQLLREGWMHNYMRMLWGKKILEWSPEPEAALGMMVGIMNRYALDGRDPNSYTGYFWTLGRYDRPWGPERPIFGTVRYMTSENTARKLRLKPYLAEYGEPN